MKKRIPIQPKIKARLQKEINSECPFCQNQDVEYFQTHHIDENPGNNEFSNLLLVCANCHSKITKGDILQSEVANKKNNLPIVNQKIEFVSVVLDSKNCAWEISSENEFAFFQNDDSQKSPFPIFNFSILNASDKTIVFRKILLEVRFLPSGITGLPTLRKLKPVAKYQIQVSGKHNKLILPNPIQIPANTAFMFQVELSEKSLTPGRFEINGRQVLKFNFEFNGDKRIVAPTIFLNCNSENEKLRITYIH